jgi:sugar/nucleoside kinase (ribokinase family)
VRVAAVGECTRDRYLDAGIDAVGGISLNFAVNARRSGAGEVALVSCTGSEGGDTAIRRKLAAEGVDATHLHTMAGATASQAIRVTEGGERFFPAGGYDPGVLAAFRLDAADLAFIATFDVVATPYYRQVDHLFHPAMEAGANAMRVADLLDGEDLGAGLAGLDPLLDVLDVAFISGGDAMVDLLLPRSRQARTLIVVTHGAGGSSALRDGVRLFEPAAPVPLEERVDSTGCGDAFQAAFTVEYFRHRDLARSLRAGAARAAEVIRHLGATGD